MSESDVAAALGPLRPMLLAMARLQLRNDAWAEDAVSETLIAALEGAGNFSGQSQVKTWVVGILKHKIIDQFRRGGREVSLDAELEAAQAESHEELFAADGHFAAPVSAWGNPEASLREDQFLQVLQACIDRLPPSLGRIFMMREWLEQDTEAICKELGISSTNCFVMLYRARMRLRECLELNWFGAGKGA